MPSLLALASTACGIGAAVTTVRWYTRRRDSLGRPRPFPVWSVSLLGVLCVATLVPGVLRHREEARLSRAASVMVGHHVSVHCQTTSSALVDAGNELGFVPYDQNGIPLPRTEIKRDACGALRHYLGGSRENPSRDEVVAVHVLTHESMHMSGTTDEAVAECKAVQRDRQMAQLLGATPRQAYKLAVSYWIAVYPDMPADYRSDECHLGGALDDHLDTPPWIRFAP